MSKRTQSNQSFSLRRIILQTARLTEGSRNQRLNDVECGTAKQENWDTVKTDVRSVDSSSSIEHSVVGSGVNQTDAVCNICFLNESEVPFFTLELCGHKFCIACLLRYLKNEISESRTDIACPQCSIGIYPNNIEFLLQDFVEIKNKYQDFMIRRYLVTDPDCRWCPAPDCTFAVIASGCASCPEIECGRPNCNTSFCYHCKAIWHPDQTCDAARTARQRTLNTSSLNFSQDMIRSDEIKPCPRCQVLIVKMNDGSCNHMACSLCGAEFCWLCMKEVSDLHYLSPSGCTFWGKKPWSRKKKIVWQIGTLIGAPVGIALLAGIAVPSIVIGIPVWAGRKLLNRYKSTSKKRRNISVAVGVTASILVAPILAGLAIAVGVPILLFYVYGIVPVSLIRAGCGNTTSDGDFKFDEQTAEQYKAQYNVDNASIGGDGASRIGETSIGDVSLSGVSGSIIEAETIDSRLNHHHHQHHLHHHHHHHHDHHSNTSNSHQESNIALAGSVQTNQQCADSIDNISSKSPSAITYNSNKTANNDTTSNIVLAGSITSYKM